MQISDERAKRLAGLLGGAQFWLTYLESFIIEEGLRIPSENEGAVDCIWKAIQREIVTPEKDGTPILSAEGGSASGGKEETDG